MEWVQTVVTLLPIAGLIWKAAMQAAELKDLRQDFERLRVKVEDEAKATDSVISTLTAMLNDIKIAVTRIETKLEERDGRR